MTLSPGSRVGRYEIRAILGAGGMGEVYLAWDSDLEREVALKVLRDGAEASSERVRRFVQEARAASGLHHPNVGHVYEIGSHDDLRFIVMEIVAGETLRRRLGSGPLPIEDVLSIGTQIAAGLAAAHKAGIVHRDVKPENVIVNADGHAKVLDFGLAKLREIRGDDAGTLLKTTPGVAMGTMGYMAPEQLSGGEVTAAADVYSLGVVLYEMVAGRRPGDDDSPLGRDTPPKLEAVISKAMSRKPGDRYPTAVEVLEELRLISRPTIAVPARKVSKKVFAALAAVLIVALGIAGVWMIMRSRRIRAAEEQVSIAEKQIPIAEKQLKDRALADAYQTAVAAAAILPNNERLRVVIATTSDRVTIDSDPPGAVVYLQRFKGPQARWRAGTTPLVIPRLPRADYIVTLEKAGYEPAVRSLATTPFYNNRGEMRPQRLQPLKVKLLQAGRVPEGMVFVPGGEYKLAGWSRPSDRTVLLNDFFIDRYEVSNAAFQEFMRAGGYRRRELWKHPFIQDGKRLSFEEAMARFRDPTGLPGPRTWVNGEPPAGREDLPVTDVTWHEAVAFAEWKGKTLPTVYQWEKAARPPLRGIVSNFPWGMVGEGVDVTERANFRGKGAMPVDSMPFGLSPFGALHMAGNVWEWCRNPKGPGFSARGGSWNDPVYTFGLTEAYPAFLSNGTVGFRCVKETEGGGDQGSFGLTLTGFVPRYQPVDDRAFAAIRSRYDYPKTPLQAIVMEKVETPDWMREKITYSSGGKRVIAYLYLPKGFARPLQVIHFSPAGDVYGGSRTLFASIEARLSPLIRGGRAVFSVVLEGFQERPSPPDSEEFETGSDYVDWAVAQVTEVRRGLDYLETRPDVDAKRIAFVAFSAGSVFGVVVAAVEPRYRSVLFGSSGISPEEVADPAGINRINFAPRIAAPKLMLQGRYDEDSPLESSARPLFRLMREPKRLEIYEGGHALTPQIFVPVINKWLDETLGPVSP